MSYLTVRDTTGASVAAASVIATFIRQNSELNVVLKHGIG